MRSKTPEARPVSAGSTILTLEDLGWQPWFAEHLPVEAPDKLSLGRVSIGYRDQVRLITIQGEHNARFGAGLSRDGLPAVGDWVLISPRSESSEAAVQVVLPRRTSFSRKTTGDAAVEQVVAANVDTVFLVEPCPALNPRRLERTLVAAWSSGARPVIILSKSDLVADDDVQRHKAERIGHGVPVLVISTLVDSGLDAVLEYCQRGQTIALIGSSGAGKSTLVNRLVGSEVARTGAVRKHDGRGRHTTSHRELIRLPHGGLIIDTPGLRELQLWDAHEGIVRAFDDIETLAQQCRFRDCSHGTEADCAVRLAVEIGSLDSKRLRSYQKLNRELQHVESKFDQRLRDQTKQRDRVIHRQMRHYRPRD